MIGFGHATLSSAQHTAFFFAINLKCLGPNRDVSCFNTKEEEEQNGREDPLSLAFMPAESFATPFSGFSYMDPTSFWMTQSDKEPISSSLNTYTNHHEDDNHHHHHGKLRLFVMCTLRAAPDYLSFDQSHHQTVIFEARTSLLDQIVNQSQNEILLTNIQFSNEDWKNQFAVTVEDDGGVWV